MFSTLKKPSTNVAQATHAFLFFKSKTTTPVKDKPLPSWILSRTVASFWQRGQLEQARNFHYEDLVRQKTSGTSQFIGPYEIDAVTDEALIQCKRSKSATENPKQFIKNNRYQIKRTIFFAKQRNLRAEFWFERTPADQVINYIQTKGGIIKVGLDNEMNFSVSR